MNVSDKYLGKMLCLCLHLRYIAAQEFGGSMKGGIYHRKGRVTMSLLEAFLLGVSVALLVALLLFTNGGGGSHRNYY